jgi:hypothetical protein
MAMGMGGTGGVGAAKGREAMDRRDRERRSGGNGNGRQGVTAKSYRDWAKKNPQRGTSGTQNTGGHRAGGLADKAAQDRGFRGVDGNLDRKGPGTTGPTIWGKTRIAPTKTVKPTWDNLWDIFKMAGSVLTGGVPSMINNMASQLNKPTGTTTRRENDSTAGEKGRPSGPLSSQAVAAAPRGVDEEDSEGELSRKRASNSAGGAGYRASLLSRAGRASVSGRK